MWFVEIVCGGDLLYGFLFLWDFLWDRFGILVRSLGQRMDEGWEDREIRGGSKEVVELAGINGIKQRGVKNIVSKVGRGLVVDVVGVVVNGLVGAPFDDEPAGLNEGLLVLNGQRLDAGDGSISHGKDLPLVARNAGAGCQRHEKKVALSVPSGFKSNRAKRTCFGHVGRSVVLEDLHVRAEFRGACY